MQNNTVQQKPILLRGKMLWTKPCKLIESPTLCKIIAEKMHQDWSPEQIGGWLKRCYPDNQEMHVSHEMIYKTLFIPTRGAFKKSCSNASEAEE